MITQRKRIDGVHPANIEVNHAGRISSAALVFERVERARRAGCVRSDAGRNEPRLWRGAARRHHRQHRARRHGQVARRRRCRVAMGRQRLHHRLCRLHPDGRRTRRPDRRQAYLHGGVCALHRGLAGLRAVSQRHRVDRRAADPGAGGGNPGAQFAGAAEPHLYGRPRARPCRRGLGRGREPGADRRSLRRRCADHAGWLARDLPRQSADRASLVCG
ncbi:hypothetical protein ACVWYH_007393 [Bradyrhizobium sp. GM24.11]